MNAAHVNRTFVHALDEFEAAWADPRHTTIELPPVDVNHVLAERYICTPQFSLTRTQVWEMEVRKAWDPLAYIPYVVSEARSWGNSQLPGDGRHHLRSSVQKAWIHDASGVVLEEVFSDPDSRRVLFLGRDTLAAPDGEILHADGYQPLFHVEHGVGGTANDPTNCWRIVVLTREPEPQYCDYFGAMVEAGWLPGFLEIYIERDLGLALRRRGDGVTG